MDDLVAPAAEFRHGRGGHGHTQLRLHANNTQQHSADIKKASSTGWLKRLDRSFALRAGQAKADASSGVTQYRHANEYTPNAGTFDVVTAWLTGT
jgi:hypothetical protein